MISQVFLMFLTFVTASEELGHKEILEIMNNIEILENLEMLKDDSQWSEKAIEKMNPESNQVLE